MRIRKNKAHLLLTALLVSMLMQPAFFVSAQETKRVYLSGTDKDNTVTWDFLVSAGRNSGKWSKIQVPSNWELQGYGNFNYGQDTDKTEERGEYKHVFHAPAEWKNKIISIVFEGSMTDTEVRINGRAAGPVHQGGFYRFQYDITKLLKFDRDNLLEVTVSKASSNKSVNEAERNADFWALGGIFRPVYLEVKPKSFIDRVAIDARADGSFNMEVYGVNVTGKHRIEARVEDLHGRSLGQVITVEGSSAAPIMVKHRFDNPDLWSSEYPNLHRVVVSLRDGKGVVHSTAVRFGFRTVEVNPGDGIYVNGKKIILKGVNRHSFWPESGRTLSKGTNLDDILLMKEMNMNAVRMSHYPPDQDFLDLCDSLGMFVVNELAGWQAAYDTEVGRKLVKELVIRDVNHPSVILWNNGNERGWNTELDNDYDLYDPQKRVVLHPIERFNGFDTKHYITYDYLVNSALYEREILLPTEFMHGLYDGGHGAALDDYWELMLRHPSCAGGFLWVFADEGVVRADRNGAIDINGNKAPDGILGPYREKEGSFFTIKEIWSPVYIDLKYLPFAFDGKIKVENRYIETDLASCDFSWRLVSYPSPNDASSTVKINASGKANKLSLSPGEKGTLDLNLPVSWNEHDALLLTARDPNGQELFTWSWPIKSPSEIAKRSLVSTNVNARIEATARDKHLTVNADGISYHFDTTTGYLSGITRSGNTVFLSGGPVLAGARHTLKKFEHRREGEAYIVEPVYEGDNTFRVRWTFASDQPVKLNYEYSYKKEEDFMGVTFQYPESNIAGMKWMGRGPYRVWKNRLRGLQFGVWQKDANNSITGESWTYPEFKGYHSELYWMRLQTNDDVPFTVYSATKGIFLQMLQPARPEGAGNNNTSPAFPDASIGFMSAISPIGTKFQKAELMGPSSQKNIMLNNTPFSGELWFDFR